MKRQLGLGARELVEPSLERGLVEFVPEYSGSALEFLTRGEGFATSDEALTHDRLEQVFAERGVAVLAPAPAQDQNGFAVTRETADRYGLRSISQLVPRLRSLRSVALRSVRSARSASGVWRTCTAWSSDRSRRWMRAVRSRSPPCDRGRWTWPCSSRPTRRST